MIWTRWTKEFLPEWNVRNKRNKKDVRQLKVNDSVCVVDGSAKRSNYKMARVLEVQKGSDGRIRSATVVTKYGKPKRPVVKLAFFFYESVFRENKTGPAMLAPVSCKIINPIMNVTDESFSRSRTEAEWANSLRQTNQLFNHPRTWHVYARDTTLTFCSKHLTPYFPRFKAINT